MGYEQGIKIQAEIKRNKLKFQYRAALMKAVLLFVAQLGLIP